MLSKVSPPKSVLILGPKESGKTFLVESFAGVRYVWNFEYAL